MKIKTIERLKKLKETFETAQSSGNNYAIGGGLTDYKFASRRHEHAKHDDSKITLGNFCAKIKSITGMETASIKELIEELGLRLEWHHAGRLPKQYGGGMKKTYFLNAEQVIFVCDHLSELTRENLPIQLRETFIENVVEYFGNGIDTTELFNRTFNKHFKTTKEEIVKVNEIISVYANEWSKIDLGFNNPDKEADNQLNLILDQCASETLNYLSAQENKQ